MQKRHNLRTIAAINIPLPERNIDDSAHYEDISEDVNIQMQGQGTLNCMPDANFVYGCFIKNAQITKTFSVNLDTNFKSITDHLNLIVRILLAIFFYRR